MKTARMTFEQEATLAGLVGLVDADTLAERVAEYVIHEDARERAIQHEANLGRTYADATDPRVSERVAERKGSTYSRSLWSAHYDADGMPLNATASVSTVVTYRVMADGARVLVGEETLKVDRLGRRCDAKVRTGRPRKYATDADRRAADAERKRKARETASAANPAADLNGA